MTLPRFSLGLLLGLLLLTGCEPAADVPQTLTVYAGRSESLVSPMVAQFEAATGITVNVRYGGTPELAVALAEEGAQSPADLFWAQDGGALGAVHTAGLLATLPDSILGHVPTHYSSTAGTWVATSGRARTLAYSPTRTSVDDLPESIFDLTDPAYKGRVGWAPANGSFQAFVTAMRALVGDDSTRAWLVGMRENGAKSYSNNRAINQGIADGEVDLGLPNHYYLLRSKAQDPAYPVEQTFFRAGDPGNLVNVAGIGVLASSTQQEAALRFISFLLSDTAQAYFADEVFEYPVTGSATPAAGVGNINEVVLRRPEIDLDDLRDLQATQAMLRDAEVI